MSQHIGVIGLGSLGANMARLLAEDGYAVHAYDLDPRPHRRARPTTPA